MASRNLKSASKSEVLETLDRSIRYCNSHKDYAQSLFDEIVDEQIGGSGLSGNESLRIHEMKSLFPVLTAPETQGFVPSIKMRQDEMALAPHQYLEVWFRRWVAKFISAWRSLPSQREAKPKGAITDYALVEMVTPHASSEEEARSWVRFHNLFMSAENIGGNLLEEYIASRVSAYGWIWCRGEILTAVDFCNDQCTEFVQVKNKSNTENSSGKGFRVSHKAPVWFRMYANKRDGKIVTCWPALVEIVRRGATRDADKISDDLLNEEDYLRFVREASRNNPHLITDEEK